MSPISLIKFMMILKMPIETLFFKNCFAKKKLLIKSIFLENNIR